MVSIYHKDKTRAASNQWKKRSIFFIIFEKKEYAQKKSCFVILTGLVIQRDANDGRQGQKQRKSLKSEIYTEFTNDYIDKTITIIRF